MNTDTEQKCDDGVALLPNILELLTIEAVHTLCLKYQGYSSGVSCLHAMTVINLKNSCLNNDNFSNSAERINACITSHGLSGGGGGSTGPPYCGIDGGVVLGIALGPSGVLGGRLFGGYEVIGRGSQILFVRTPPITVPKPMTPPTVLAA